ncbi:hypothetical protein R70723_18540 [Paenibacillus sp. FSL R7-0273]|uniref:hypothetical protein n=1 Tax=Paenibacillus sp. FSL R7-0273 TaxID=1536772 RepID=UPI0004F5DDC0|nr:hypothetical protein [Paenibacillus sp. FSL R7-0273]AIQ47669.1 hypothetical protein R70723_18540 [Paenibacillus sp. FSL R7-0273]OMF95773.1 hypothetical protein BK144_04085 [Paenibacillus sp. FSL R7-0273]
MRTLIAYMLKSYSTSQRYFAPVAAIIIFVLFLYTYKPNPVMSSYAATGIILFIGCAWLGISFLNHEQAVQRQVTIVQLRSSVKYSLGGILTLAVLTSVLAMLAVMYPVLTGSFAEPAGIYRIALAFAGHLLLGMLGVSLSLFLQTSWVPKASYATGLLLIILILSVSGLKLADLIPGPLVPLLLPPAALLMDAMMHAEERSLPGLLGTFAHAMAYILLLSAFYLYRSGRMDYGRHL